MSRASAIRARACESVGGEGGIEVWRDGGDGKRISTKKKVPGTPGFWSLYSQKEGMRSEDMKRESGVSDVWPVTAVCSYTLADVPGPKDSHCGVRPLVVRYTKLPGRAVDQGVARDCQRASDGGNARERGGGKGAGAVQSLDAPDVESSRCSVVQTPE